MFGEISIWTWMGAAITFAIGGGAGFFIARQIKDKRTLELEEKLAATRGELAEYRGDVNQHFLKTSLLLGKLTNNYREVYEHLATGAQKLCNEKTGTPKLDLPDTKILPSMESAAIEAVTKTAVEHKQEEEQIIEASDETIEQHPKETVAEIAEEQTKKSAETAEKLSTEPSPEQNAARPAPEDIPDSKDDEDVHLGEESAPSVDTELHKTHPAIH